MKITNVETNNIINFESIRAAAKELEVSPETIRRYIKNKRFLKNKYLIQLN